MRTIGNILWFFLAGLWLAIGYAVFGLLMFLLFFLIVTIPFGIASFRLANYALWPFGRTVVPDPSAGAGSAIGNVIWFLLAGLWMAIGQIVTGLLLCITIIGIPFGIASFKMAGLALFPLGKKIVSIDEAQAIGQAVYIPS
ncbi:MAG: YccF domain-containing protein [Candidatus Nanopelagicales bacterium]